MVRNAAYDGWLFGEKVCDLVERNEMEREGERERERETEKHETGAPSNLNGFNESMNDQYLLTLVTIRSLQRIEYAKISVACPNPLIFFFLLFISVFSFSSLPLHPLLLLRLGLDCPQIAADRVSANRYLPIERIMRFPVVFK